MDLRTKTRTIVAARLSLALVIAGMMFLGTIDKTSVRAQPAVPAQPETIQHHSRNIGMLVRDGSSIESPSVVFAVYKIAGIAPLHPGASMTTLVTAPRKPTRGSNRALEHLRSLMLKYQAPALLLSGLLTGITCVIGACLAFSVRRSRILLGMSLIIVGFLSHFVVLSCFIE